MTLICLVSGQLAPNLLSVLHFKPDEVVLVCTSDSRDLAERFKDLLISKYQFESVHISETNPFHLSEIQESAVKLAEQFKARKMILNYTGGTKPMSVGFVNVFSKLGTDLLYTDSQQECFWLSKNNEVLEIPFDFRFNLQTMFELKDVVIKSQADVRVLENMKSFTDFIFQEKQKEKESLIYEVFDNAVKVRINRKNLATWNPDLQFSGFEIKTISDQKISVTWNEETFIQKKKNFWLEYFSGGWFEQWCYMVLNDSGDFDDVQCNIKIRPNTNSHPKGLKNEIDVAAISNGRPLFVECKTGNIDQKSITNLKAVMDYYGPKYSQGILISLWPLRRNQEVLREKLSDYNISLIEGPDMLEEKLIEISNEIILKL